MFEACLDSYCLECLADFIVCPICRVEVENAIGSYFLAANRSVNPSRNTAGIHDGNLIEGEKASGNGNSNDHCTADGDDYLPTSVMNANVDQILQYLTPQVMFITVRPPPFQVYHFCILYTPTVCSKTSCKYQHLFSTTFP